MKKNKVKFLSKLAICSFLGILCCGRVPMFYASAAEQSEIREKLVDMGIYTNTEVDEKRAKQNNLCELVFKTPESGIIKLGGESDKQQNYNGLVDCVGKLDTLINEQVKNKDKKDKSVDKEQEAIEQNKKYEYCEEKVKEIVSEMAGSAENGKDTINSINKNNGGIVSFLQKGGKIIIYSKKTSDDGSSDNAKKDLEEKVYSIEMEKGDDKSLAVSKNEEKLDVKNNNRSSGRSSFEFHQTRVVR